jgi:imidazolonepropionase-like amidohydrolase
MSAGLLAILLITQTSWMADDGRRIEGDVRIENGRITALGKDLPRDGVQVVDGSGTWLTPGLIEANSMLGLTEVALESSTRDDDLKGPPIRARFFVEPVLDPHSLVIPIQRAHGLTLAISRPTGGTIAGQAAALRLDGRMLPDPVAMFAQLGADGDRSRMGRLAELRGALEDAQFWARNRKAFDKGATRPLSIQPADARALQPVLAGRLPLVVQVNRRVDIRATVALAKAFGLKLVLLGAAEAWTEAKLLAENNVAVIVDPLLAMPTTFDARRARQDQAALLAQAGVTIILSSFETHQARTLRQIAGNAVRAGLSHQAALDAITRAPAEVFGLGDRGRIAVGQIADLVLWTGDPFEPLSHAKQVFIEGVPQSNHHRQKALFERYRRLP